MYDDVQPPWEPKLDDEGNLLSEGNYQDDLASREGSSSKNFLNEDIESDNDDIDSVKDNSSLHFLVALKLVLVSLFCICV